MNPESELRSDCCAAHVRVEGSLKGTQWHVCSKCGHACDAEEVEPAAPYPYPEHDKLEGVAHLSQAQHSFIEWLEQKKGIVLAEKQDIDGYSRLCWLSTSIDKLLAEFHGIDMSKIEAEKRAMLKVLRSQNPDPKE